MEIIEKIYALQDIDFRRFHCALIPTVPPKQVIGVRTSVLRSLAKELRGTPEAAVFLSELPHRYYEENNLHAFLIEEIRDYSDCIRALNTFLPYIDNWATCDSMSPKVLGKHPHELLHEIRRWIVSEHTYTVRFAIGMLMRWYLDGHFSPEYLRLVASVRSEEYYVNMMVAWYFATALAKQYTAALPFFQSAVLPPWTHNKAIQKALESRRITQAQKEYLRTLKVKYPPEKPA